jgi:hypothetical protein
MDRHTRQEPVCPGRCDGGWVGPRTIGADPVRREQRLVLQRLAKEPFGRVEIALRREEEINRGAVLVDGPVQRKAVGDFLNSGRWDLIAEFVEVESSKQGNRPKLTEALAFCRLHNATLVIAKLDRLSRDAACNRLS